MSSMSEKPFVVIGTSGSPDYLQDHVNDARRFWSVGAGSDEESPCDGLHAEGAPVQYLCSRCFPNLAGQALRGDLQALDEDEYAANQRDDEGEHV